ncbi:MAG TPA: methyl-accepting chemotaxis protein [Methanoregula sp.]|nr:methyl-accepting chemotaxis protein [Methanoregula sp.]
MTGDLKNYEGSQSLEECQKENKQLRSRLAVADLVYQGLDRMDIPIHVIDKNYRIIYINQKCLQMLGMTRNQAMGRYCHDLYKTKNCRTEICPCRMAMARDEFAECENLTGTKQIIQCYAAPIKDTDGNIIGSIEYFPDVTQQKQALSDILRVADEATNGNFNTRTDSNLHKGDYLKISNGINQILDIVIDKMVYYEAILNSIKSPISVTDADNRWTFINKALEDMLHVRRENILGKNCSNWGATICNTDKCGINRLKKGYNTTEFEQAGGYYTVDCSYIKNAQGQSVGHVEVINDVSIMKKSQKYMEKEINELIKIYSKMAEGDLTPRYNLTAPDELTREVHEELKKLQAGVQGIIGNLENNLQDINSKMLNLTTTADNAASSVTDASKSINQIAKNVGSVSESAQKSSESVDQMSRAMQDMSAAVEEITSSMENVQSQAQNANSAAKNGAILAENVNKNMDAITQSAGSTYLVIQDIEKQMSDIGKIIVLIRDLANQTNLLALNAAIEAARAGEHGRGFAVVASEVKSLAQESRSSAEKIEEMITQLNTVTKKAADGMEEARTIVGKGAEESQKALDAFRSIQKAAEIVANSATEVASATQEQAATTEEITASVTEVARLIERTAKEAGDAAAASEETAAAIDEIARLGQEVGRVAVEAMEANKKFKVN